MFFIVIDLLLIRYTKPIMYCDCVTVIGSRQCAERVGGRACILESV